MRQSKGRRFVHELPVTPTRGPRLHQRAADWWSAWSPGITGAAAAVVLLVSAAAVPSFAATPHSVHAATLDPANSKSQGKSTQDRNEPNVDMTQLVAERSANLADAVAVIEDARQNELLSSHHRRSSAAAKLIKAENKRLRNLSIFLWPTEGDVGSPFGWRIHPILGYRRLHNGADIGGACNNPIYAAQAGIVVKTGLGYSGGSGNNVRIDHGSIDGRNIQTAYLHMTRFIVKVGQRVDKGQLIGYVGSTGLSTACHLHLSLYKDGVGSDPLEYVKK